MSRNNTIGIVGTITEKPHLILDATDWKRKVFETKIKRTRPSGAEDEAILQYSGQAAGSKEMLDKITEGAEVFVGGEIRTQNIKKPKSTQSRVKIYIFAELIGVNDPPVEDQNEVKICGHICREPRTRNANKRAGHKKAIPVTDIIVAVNNPAGSHYIPCVCWQNVAEVAAQLEVGTYVEIYGRLQSRQFKKYIKDKPAPYLMTAYEVSVIEMGLESNEEDE